MLHAVRFEEQACQVLAFSISEEVEKRPFAPLIIDSSQIFFNEFPETNLVLFTYYQCDLLMESLMLNCLDLHYRDRYLSQLCILVKPSELV